MVVLKHPCVISSRLEMGAFLIITVPGGILSKTLNLLTLEIKNCTMTQVYNLWKGNTNLLYDLELRRPGLYVTT